MSSLVALAIVLGACGGAALGPSAASASPTSVTRNVPFVEVASAQDSSYRDDNPAIAVGTNSAAAIVALVPQASATPGRVLVAAFAGEQRTGGYGIRIDRVERDGARLVVHVTFTEPAPGAIVTQALTSPAHVVSIAQADRAGAREALLLDGTGAERAHTTLP